VPINVSDTEWGRAVVARTDPNDQESVDLLPNPDELPQITAQGVIPPLQQWAVEPSAMSAPVPVRDPGRP
jgi:hypothetical protein